MANQERGEFTLTAGGSSYVLRLTTNSCCELEEFCGRSFENVQQGANRNRLSDTRLILWAALQEHHADLALKTPDGLKAVGRIIDAAGGTLSARGKKFFAQMVAFIALNADSGETEGGAATADRPLVAQAGTGGSSTSTH